MNPLAPQPKSFVWKRTGYGDVGYIAEDVNAILPEIYREQGITKGYDLWKLPFFIIEELKGQQERIDSQKLTLARQHQALAAQGMEINSLILVYCGKEPSAAVCAKYAGSS